MVEGIQLELACEARLPLAYEVLEGLHVVGLEGVGIGCDLKELYVAEAAVLGEVVVDGRLGEVGSCLHQPPKVVEQSPVERLEHGDVSVVGHQELVLTRSGVKIT